MWISEKKSGGMPLPSNLPEPMREVPPHMEAPGHRYTDAELAAEAREPEPGRGRGRGRGNFDQSFARRRTQFWIDEGVAAVLDTSRGDDGTGCA